MAVLAAPGSALAFGPIGGFAKYGPAAGQLSLTTGVEIGPDGRVYLADLDNNRVDVFSATGEFIRAFGKAVSPSGGSVCTTATGCQKGVADGSAGAVSPVGIEIDSAGTLYLAGGNSARVDVFSPEGAFIRAFGKGVNPAGGNVCTTASGCQKGTGDYTAGSLMSVLGLDVDPSGLLYVASANDRIDVFTREGSFVRGFGKGVNPAGGNVCTTASGCQKGKEPATAGGMSTPFDVVVNPAGQVAVTDYYNRRVDIFDSNGVFLRAFGRGVSPAADASTFSVCTTVTGCRAGSEGPGAGAMAYTAGVAVNAQGNILVGDATNNRINEYTFAGAFLRAFGEGVVNGEPVFQVCTTATTCRAGLISANAGSIPYSFGVTTDCMGGIYTTSWTLGGAGSIIKRFGEPATPNPPCAAPPAPGGGGAAQASASSESQLLGSGRRTTAKPSIKIELNRGSGTASLVVIVSDPGTLLLKGKGIRKLKRQAKRSGLVELLVTPTGALKRKLEEMGKAAVKLTLTFNADNGASNTQTKAFALKMVAPL